MTQELILAVIHKCVIIHPTMDKNKIKKSFLKENDCMYVRLYVGLFLGVLKNIFVIDKTAYHGINSIASQQ